MGFGFRFLAVQIMSAMQSSPLASLRLAECGRGVMESHVGSASLLGDKAQGLTEGTTAI